MKISKLIISLILVFNIQAAQEKEVNECEDTVSGIELSEKYTCKQCGYRCSSLYELDCHAVLTHPSRPKRYVFKCKYCNLETYSGRYFNKHVSDAHHK